MELDTALYKTDKGPCPYLDGRRWQTLSIFLSQLSPDDHRLFLNRGWRRSGNELYLNSCPGCSACVPYRVDVRRFAPSPSQRRTLRKNRDLHAEVLPLSAASGSSGAALLGELHRLYCVYAREWHRHRELPGLAEFADAFCRPVTDSFLSLFRDRQGKLVGAGWLDRLPDGLSTVYFAFDPAESARRLGVYSVLREIGIAREEGLDWYYMGFYVSGCQSMEYKIRYRPGQILDNGHWRGHRAEEKEASERIQPGREG